MIYPPNLQSTQSAFLASTSPYKIYFSLSSANATNEIQHIQVLIQNQSNNSILISKEDSAPDGIYYYDWSKVEKKDGRYCIGVQAPWVAGSFYKIQIRFGSNAKYSDSGTFATWKSDAIEKGYFSEWSNVMIVKAIDKPTIRIINGYDAHLDVMNVESIEASLTPQIEGSFSSVDERKSKCRFTLYYEDQELDSSGWITARQGNDVHIFKHVLTDGETYRVSYEVETVNGYVAKALDYNFIVDQVFISDLTGIAMRVIDNDAFNQENGCIDIRVTAAAMTGNYVLSRSSEKTGYTIWEDLHYFMVMNEDLVDTLIYRDFTIESGIGYKYALQMENSAGLRTSPLYPSGNPVYRVDLEYAYLYGNGVQLKLCYNNNMNSFKHTVLRSKQDTLGDRYPYLAQNGHAYYAEFPVTGLISFNMDNDETFFSREVDGWYYVGERVVPIERVIEDESLGTRLSAENAYVERVFREKVEEFLNNFDYKLYRSATEGNIVVTLMNVSLTPNQTLGRMVYSFSATAYEVMENSIENLDRYGLIKIGSYESPETTTIASDFGQVSGIYGSDVDIAAMIREKETRQLDNGFSITLDKITSIKVYGYPEVDLMPELTELYNEREEAIAAGRDTEDIDREIEHMEALQHALQAPAASPINLLVNGAAIRITPNMIYQVAFPINSLSLVSSEYPIIVDYTCDLIQVEDDSAGVISSIDTSRIWGQLEGVFGEEVEIRGYIFDDATGSFVPITSSGYSSLDIYTLIQDDARHQVEKMYGVVFNKVGDNWVADNGSTFRFIELTKIDIETAANTIVTVNGRDMIIGNVYRSEVTLDSGETVEQVTQDMINRLILDKVTSVAFKRPAQAIINYQCITTQNKIGG